jgi:hypothetical protein
MGIGMGELLIILAILLFFACAGAIIFAGFYFLTKYLSGAGAKACPHCGEKIKEAAKICRYCQRDVASVEIENKTPRGLFQ